MPPRETRRVQEVRLSQSVTGLTLSCAFCLCASSAWLIAGIAKVTMPAPAEVSGISISSQAVLAFGIIEISAAVAWLLNPRKPIAATVSLLTASSFAVGILVGLVTPETCACFGSLKLSVQKHLLAIGFIIVSSAMPLVLHDREVRNKVPS